MRTYTLLHAPTPPEVTAGASAPCIAPDQVLQGLNPVQREAAAAVDGPVLLIAGPGSGKTRTLTHRIAYLLATGRAQPYQILALTFTNRAAREMRDRVLHLLGADGARGLWMGTFHSVFARILRREATRIGFTSDFSIYDAEDSERVIREVMTDLHIDPKRFHPRAIRQRISGAKNKLIAPAEFSRAASEPFDEAAARVFFQYDPILRRANALDFDDLLVKPILLFDQHPDVLQHYQERWRYLHIDEYQDTNHAQYRIARMLAARHQNVCVVGDDAQSIYAFRGADIENILSFQRDYPAATVIRLEQNYRSTQRILQLADDIISRNQHQLEKSLWTENPLGEPVVLLEALTERDEAQKVERRIRDLCVRHGVALREIAVLYRTNAQSRSLEDALRRGAIPYRLVGSVSFYGRREIKDALAYLRLVVNPASEADLRRIINFPARGIGDKTLQRVAAFARARDLTLWQALERAAEIGLGGRAESAIRGFVEMIDRYRARAATTPAGELARDLVQESGILTQLRQENTVESLQRWENVQELISAIAEFTQEAPEGAGSLSEFLQQIALVTDADTDAGDPNRVTLMTLHASKGLEFRVVFITGLEEGLFPLAAAIEDQTQLAEERRLLYVGVTRAEELLFLACARNRFRFGEQQPAVRSRFIDEIAVENVVYTEAGRPFKGKKDRFSLGPGETAAYGEVDPHYYRRSLREEPQPARAQPLAERRVVYDEGEAQVVPGIRVVHGSFGEGKVIAVEGQGERAAATVFFPEVGQKKLKLRFAGLQVLG